MHTGRPPNVTLGTWASIATKPASDGCALSTFALLASSALTCASGRYLMLPSAWACSDSVDGFAALFVLRPLFSRHGQGRRVWGLWETAFGAVFHRIHTLLVRATFEGGRADLAQRRVATSLVIEHLDVVEQLHLGLPAAGEAIRRLALDGRKERFHDGIVLAVPATAHRARDPVRVEHPL